MSTIRVDLGFEPRAHQDAAHEVRKRFKVLVWHRRSGKTFFALMELILGALDCVKTAPRFAYVAPFYGQAKSVAWDVIKGFASKIPSVQIKEGELTVVMPNGATIRLYGADNPDSLRGLYFDGIVLDEVADMKSKMWGEIIRPALTDREGWAIFIGTPKGINLFSELYYDALIKEDWHADMKRASETNAISPAELEAARKEMTPSQYAQEMECDFAAAVENALIPLDLARAALGKAISLDSYHYSPVIMGVDVARYGDDRSCIFIRQGLTSFAPSVYRQVNTMELSNHVIAHITKHKPDAVFIDEGAMGPAVIDRCRQLGHHVIGVNFGSRASNPRFRNIRSEMWWKVSDWLKEGGCLPKEESLLADLCAPTFSFDNAKNIFDLESKDDMKKRGHASPDIGDALALTFAAPVQKISDAVKMGFNPGGSKPNTCVTDYPLFE